MKRLTKSQYEVVAKALYMTKPSHGMTVAAIKAMSEQEAEIYDARFDTWYKTVLALSQVFQQWDEQFSEDKWNDAATTANGRISVD